MAREGPYYDGRVHVLRERCSTCVFRPGNLMRLGRGRLADLVESNVAGDSALTCHSTLYRDDVEPAVCRGFFDGYTTTPLQLAERLGLIMWMGSPPRWPE